MTTLAVGLQGHHGPVKRRARNGPQGRQIEVEEEGSGGEGERQAGRTPKADQVTRYRLECRTRADGRQSWRIQYQKPRTHWLWWLGFTSKKWDWVYWRYDGAEALRGEVAIFQIREYAVSQIRYLQSLGREVKSYEDVE